MKNKILLLFSFFVVYQSISAQSAFSYKRQLNYQQCKKCDCKISRSYKIISTNLTSTQLVCAQEDNRANLTVKEMFQNGTSGGLFGGFNPPQEGCGNDCYHEFVNASDEVETVKIDECLTESQRQKNRDEQERVKNEEIKLDQEKTQNAKNEQKRINELRISAINNYKQNNLILSIEKYKEIVAYHIKNKTYKYYDQEVRDLSDLSWMLIKNKQFEEAYKYSSEAWNNSYWTPLDLSVNYCHSILLCNKNMDQYWSIVKDYFNGSYPTSSGINYGYNDFKKGKEVLDVIKKDYKILDSIGVKDSRFPVIIDKMEQEFEQRWEAYGVVFSKYFNQSSYTITDEVKLSMQKQTVRLAKSTKTSEDLCYFYGGDNLTFFYFILPIKSDYLYSDGTVKWKGSIIILNSFNIKNNEPPSDKKMAKALERKIELEKVFELEKGIILENGKIKGEGKVKGSGILNFLSDVLLGGH